MKRALLMASLLATTIVHADPEDVRRDCQRQFRDTVMETESINRNRLGRDLHETPATACAATIAKAKAAGLPPETEFQFMDLGIVPLSKIQALVCTPYERAVHAAEAAQMLATTTDGKECAAEMDRLLKFGIGDIEIEARDVALKLGEAKKKICEPVAKGQPISKAEKEKARDATAAPYVAAGITGSKLNICILNSDALRGPGGVTLAPPKIKRASLLFVLKGPVEGVYTLQRLTFKGDDLDSVSDKTFNEAPVAADYK